jgi:hypothetical protein
MKIPLEELLTSDINRPARYLGNEFGSHHKPWDEARVRWVLTYPEVYELGASNLGHIILYNILNTTSIVLIALPLALGNTLSSHINPKLGKEFGITKAWQMSSHALMGAPPGYHGEWVTGIPLGRPEFEREV